MCSLDLGHSARITFWLKVTLIFKTKTFYTIRPALDQRNIIIHSVSHWACQCMCRAPEPLVHVNRSRQSSSSGTLLSLSLRQTSVWCCCSRFRLRLYTLDLLLFSSSSPFSVSSLWEGSLSSCELGGSGICGFCSFSAVKADWRFW